MRSSPLFYLCLFFIISLQIISKLEAKSNVHIVYLGERQHKDPNLITNSHHEMLADVVGSKEAASELMVCSYRHAFSGFAAKLTESQVKKLSDLPGVISVIPNVFLQLQTTRSWDLLGLSSNSPNNLLHKGNKGDGVIIGVLDTGIWPESKSFEDEGVGPIPSHWKGSCKSGDQFNATINCNKKIIGARWYINGLLAETGHKLNTSVEYLSARDANGHGTYVSSIALGSEISNISYKGLATGTMRGGAPHARLAMYKVCWNLPGRCSSVDVLHAFDDAIHDGVDVLSISLGFSIPNFPDVDGYNPFAIGSFHAVARGITVVYAGGNDGPSAYTVINTEPWVLTIGATTVDRIFPTPITLGNNKTILGQALFTGNESGFTGLFYPGVNDNHRLLRGGHCDEISINPSMIAGKIVICFMTKPNLAIGLIVSTVLREAGAVGVIVATNPTDILIPCPNDFPCIAVDHEAGTQIISYIRLVRSPIVKLSTSKTYFGKPLSAKVAYFSSRGPNSLAPAVLKPDIAAPGANILAANIPNDPMGSNGCIIGSGTSAAAPHVSGIVALLKEIHPDWSPAAIKSALVTTAHNNDWHDFPIFAEGSPRKIANPFDIGGGIVNPNAAADPGLVYDMNINDYILFYLCAMNYNVSSISRLTTKPTTCPSIRPSILDLNQPSITIPNLKNSTTITRTVTNVGPINSIYKAIISPPKGTIVATRPNVLVFNSTTKRVSFRVTITSTTEMNGDYYFGSLTWSDGLHAVKSPISVRTEFIPSYSDFK